MAAWSLKSTRSKKMEAFELKEDQVLLDGSPAFRLSDVERVQLDKVLATEYNSGHFLLRIRAKGQNWAWQALLSEPQHLLDYREAALALHQALGKGRPSVQFLSGLRSPLLFWGFNIFFGAMFALLEVAIYFGTQRKGNWTLGIAAMIVLPVIGVGFLLFAAKFIKPRKYSPSDIPPDLLPAAQV